MLVFCNGFAFSTKASTPIIRSPDNGWDETGHRYQNRRHKPASA